MNTRIKALRKELGLTQTAFASRVGMKQNTITLIETGKRNTSDFSIRNICREFNVNEHWLRTGEGEMFLPRPSSALEELAEEYRLNAADRVLVQRILDLKPEARQAVADFAKKLAADLARLEQRTAPPAPSTDEPTPEELHAELDRQLSLEEKATDESGASGKRSS